MSKLTNIYASNGLEARQIFSNYSTCNGLFEEGKIRHKRLGQYGTTELQQTDKTVLCVVNKIVHLKLRTKTSE